MKARLEDGVLLVDFNSRGWNPQEVMEMNEKQFDRFIDISKSNYESFEYMELSHLVDVIITMAIDGDIKWKQI